MLEKWYLDVATSDRRAAIGYAASLAWRGLRVSWQGITTYAPGAPPSRRWSARRDAMPRRNGMEVRWDAPAIGTRVHASATLPPIEERLYTNGDGGAVDWRCHAPAALVQVEGPAGAPLSGAGYAERLVMTIPPWRLPLHEMNWGRWSDVSGAHALVWLEWRGDATRRWAWLDGTRVDVTIEQDRICSAGFHLSLGEHATLEHRRFDEIARGIPRLLRILPASIREMQEVKWLSSGLLHRPGSDPTPGLAIHERVVMG